MVNLKLCLFVYLFVYFMDCFEERVKTFANWPRESPSAHDLSVLGLYYDPTDVPDRVTCYLCSVAIQNWQDGDSAQARHHEAFCECPLVIIYGQIKNPLLQHVKSARRATFKRYPHRSPYLAVPARLVEAGFVHWPTPEHRDRVFCPHCEIKVFDWQQDQDPRQVHLERSPECRYMAHFEGRANDADQVSNVQDLSETSVRPVRQRKTTQPTNLETEQPVLQEKPKRRLTAPSRVFRHNSAEESPQDSDSGRPKRMRKQSLSSDATLEKRASTSSTATETKDEMGRKRVNSTRSSLPPAMPKSVSNSSLDDETDTSKRSFIPPSQHRSFQQPPPRVYTNNNNNNNFIQTTFLNNQPMMNSTDEGNLLKQFKDLQRQLDRVSQSFRTHVQLLEHRHHTTLGGLATTPVLDMAHMRQQLSDYETTCASLSMAVSQKDAELSKLNSTNTYLQSRIEALVRENSALRRMNGVPSPHPSTTATESGAGSKRASPVLFGNANMKNM